MGTEFDNRSDLKRVDPPDRGVLVPENWQDILAQADPFLSLPCPNWRSELECVSRDGEVFHLAVPSKDGSIASLFSSVSDINLKKVNGLISFIGENFLKDDDAKTSVRDPWTRLLGYKKNDQQLLSLAAVSAGVKPAALIDDYSLFNPDIRVALGALNQNNSVIESVYENMQYAIGRPEAVFQIQEAFKLREEFQKNSNLDLPDVYYQMLGDALGYSDSAIGYFISRLRNGSFEKTSKGKA